MRISELLAQKEENRLICADSGQSLLAAAGILLEHRIGALLVVDESERFVGIITERDIVRSLVQFENGIADCTVEGAMTRSVISCSPEDDVVATLAVMNENKFRHMPVVSEGQPVAMLSIREFDAACRHLQALSRTDELTGLANRRHFVETLAAELKRHNRQRLPLCLAMLDIDHFKQVNDRFGHEAGDHVLRHIAGVFRRRLRGYDVVGRLGGEEFALLFPNTPLNDAVAVCEDLGTRIRGSGVKTAVGEINYTASFGVVVAIDERVDCDAILARADKLLYRAKHEGRDRVVSESARSETAHQSGRGGKLAAAV